MCQVREQPALVVEHLRADRDGELDVLAVGAVLVSALPVHAALGLEAALAREEREVAQVWVHRDDDVAALAPVTTVRTALRHVLLPPEAETAVASATATHFDARPVVEHAVSGRVA